MYNFDMEKITQLEPRPALKFWNPALDFVSITDCIPYRTNSKTIPQIIPQNSYNKTRYVVERFFA